MDAQCQIDAGTRNKCQFCRYQRCIYAGMSQDGGCCHMCLISNAFFSLHVAQAGLIFILSSLQLVMLHLAVYKAECVACLIMSLP